jgi:ABC-2 type transport system permease protein
MSGAVVAPSGVRAAMGRPTSLWPFFVQEYLRVMRSRTAKLSAAMMLYAVVTMPLLMARPPEEMVRGISTWLGAEDVHRKLFFFIWIDGAMNKFAVIMGTVLAGGIIADERARGTLDLLAAKPVRGVDYFLVKLAASAATLGTLYAGGVLLGLLTFPLRVAGFDARGFLALSAVHFFAVIFAATLAGTMAVHFKSKLTGMLVSVMVLFTLVGTAFLGFYWPAARAASHVNPYFHGVALIAAIDRFGVADIAIPIAWLIAFNLAVGALGCRRAAVVLAGAEDKAHKERRERRQVLGPARKPLDDSGRGGHTTEGTDDLSTRADQGQSAPVHPFRALLLEEARYAVRRSHVVALAVLALVGLFDALVLPLLPESIYRFFTRVFHLSGWAEIVLVNDYVGVVTVLYWVGIFDVLRVLVVPREEHYLDLLLSKPLDRSAYLLARLIPALAVTALMGVVAAALHGLSAVVFVDGVDVGAFAGASAILIGWTVSTLAIAGFITMSMRDSYYAIGAAFVPWFLMLVPATVYMYRPDVFMAAPGLADRLAFPVNLLWNDAFVARWGGPIAVALFLLAAAIVALAGRRLSRRDVA